MLGFELQVVFVKMLLLIKQIYITGIHIRCCCLGLSSQAILVLYLGFQQAAIAVASFISCTRLLY